MIGDLIGFLDVIATHRTLIVAVAPGHDDGAKEDMDVLSAFTESFDGIESSPLAVKSVDRRARCYKHPQHGICSALELLDLRSTTFA